MYSKKCTTNNSLIPNDRKSISPPPLLNVTPNTVNKKSHYSELTPTRGNENDQNLREKDNITSIKRNNTIKRKSLIIPLIPSDSPSSVDTSVRTERIVSTGNISSHSRTSSISSVPTAIGAPLLNTTSHSFIEESSDVSILLQQLANKELDILEQKKQIDDLKRQLIQKEQVLQSEIKELKELKLLVSQALNSHPYGKNILHHNHIQSSSDVVYKQESFDNEVQHQNYTNNITNLTTSTPSKRESMWSKPLHLFNQFDQIIQEGLEKKLGFDDLISSPDTTPIKLEYSRESTNDHSYKDNPTISTASNTLWNFVHDMKLGLLGINEEPEDDFSVDCNMKQFKTKNHSKDSIDSVSINRLSFVEDIDEKNEPIISSRLSEGEWNSEKKAHIYTGNFTCRQ